jgi:hypothetical protein
MVSRITLYSLEDEGAEPELIGKVDKSGVERYFALRLRLQEFNVIDWVLGFRRLYHEEANSTPHRQCSGSLRNIVPLLRVRFLHGVCLMLVVCGRDGAGEDWGDCTACALVL